MFITKKHVSRRTILKGMGVTVALPVLDAMVPASTAWARTAAAASSSKVRFVAMEMVHGCAGSTAIGVKKNLWAPAHRKNATSRKTSTAGTRSSPCGAGVRKSEFRPMRRPIPKGVAEPRFKV